MELKRRKILIFVDWFLPGYKAGGPIRSVANIAESLLEVFDIHIVTSNKDHGETETYRNIEFNVWIETKGYKVMYLSSVENICERISATFEGEELRYGVF